MSVLSIPQAGIKSINNIDAPSGNINLTSPDGTILINPVPSTKTIELSVAGVGTVLADLPCLASVYVGAIVYSDSGTITNAIADGSQFPNVLGVVESKSSTTLCNVRFTGITNSIFAGLNTTKEYFLSNTVPGGVMTSAPSSSGHYILPIGKPLDGTKLVVHLRTPIKRG